MHWAFAYIGTPWTPTGEGPDSFYCWSFFRHIQAHHYGRAVSEIPNPEDLLAQARAFRDNAERLRWAVVDKPQDGDGVLMRRARYPVHVGVWVEAETQGGVLHCIQGAGVVFQRLQSLAVNGLQVEGFYRFRGD